MRAELHFFSGLSFSGNRETVRVFVGGRRQGSAVDGAAMKSMGVIAPIGTRVVLVTSEADEGWEQHPWRAVVLVAGSTFKSRDGRDGVQVPDLDWMDAPGARRSDPDFQAGFPQVEALAKGVGWTYGRSDGPLKGRIRAIRMDLVT